MDYLRLIEDAPGPNIDDLVEFLRVELPYLWLDVYVAQAHRPTNVTKVELGTFVYLYDHYSELGLCDTDASGSLIEDRLVGAFGTSVAPVEIRDPSRARGWVGPTERRYGRNRDKGHVFGRALGGGTDGPGINTWIQLRSLNRGWSKQGKAFRKMETFCAANPGTFCFAYPSYAGQTCEVVSFDFGILLPEAKLWVEHFENQD